VCRKCAQISGAHARCARDHTTAGPSVENEALLLCPDVDPWRHIRIESEPWAVRYFQYVLTDIRGHESITITQCYAHLSPAYKRDAVNAWMTFGWGRPALTCSRRRFRRFFRSPGGRKGLLTPNRVYPKPFNDAAFRGSASAAISSTRFRPSSICRHWNVNECGTSRNRFVRLILRVATFSPSVRYAIAHSGRKAIESNGTRTGTRQWPQGLW
jgi:hypothetical protein